MSHPQLLNTSVCHL